MKYSYLQIVRQQIALHRGLLIVASFFFLFPAIFAGVGFATYLYDTNIVKSGERSEATIYLKKIIDDPDIDSNGKLYEINYHFPLKSRTDMETKYPGSDTIPREKWDKLKVGSKLEVAYDPKNPDRNFPVDGGGVTSFGLMIFMGIVCLVPMGLSSLVFYGLLVHLSGKIYSVVKKGQRGEIRLDSIDTIPSSDGRNGRLFRFVDQNKLKFKLEDPAGEKKYNKLKLGQSLEFYTSHLPQSEGVLVFDKKTFLLEADETPTHL